MQTLIVGIACIAAGTGILAATQRVAAFTQRHWAKKLDARFADSDPLYFRVYSVFFGLATIAAGLTVVFVVDR